MVSGLLDGKIHIGKISRVVKTRITPLFTKKKKKKLRGYQMSTLKKYIQQNNR